MSISSCHCYSISVCWGGSVDRLSNLIALDAVGILSAVGTVVDFSESNHRVPVWVGNCNHFRGICSNAATVVVHSNDAANNYIMAVADFICNAVGWESYGEVLMAMLDLWHFW